MPERRLLGDITPETTQDQRLMGGAYPTEADIPIEELEAEQGYDDGGPTEFERYQDERAREREIAIFEAEEERFEAELMQLIDEMGRAFDSQRNAENIMARYRLAERRSKAELDIKVDDQGYVIRNLDDGDRQLGLTFGKSMSAVNTAVAVWNEFLFDSGPAPNDIVAQGQSDENSDKEEMIAAIMARQHEDAGYMPTCKQFVFDMCRFPAAVMRQQYVKKIATVRQKSGDFAESIIFEGLQLKNWPLPWVWFSDPQRRNASDQRAVIWYDRYSLSELEMHEAVWEWDEAGQREVTAGRFFSLEQLRREDDDRMPIRQFSDATRGRLFTEWTGDGRTIDQDKEDIDPIYGLLEVQGRIPMQILAMSGALTPRVVKAWKMPIANPEKMTRRELGRAVARLHWRIAVSDQGWLHECVPTETNPPRHEALVGTYVPSDGLYGKSVIDLGVDLEDAMDRMLNDNLLISWKRANPNYILDDQAVYNAKGEKLTVDEMKKLLRGISEMIFSRAVDTDKAIQPIFPELNPEWMAEIQIMAQQYDERTLINQELRGSAQSQTATEAKQDLARSSVRGIDRAKAVAESVIEPIDRNLLSDLECYLKPEDFQNYCIRVAGEVGLKAHYEFPTLDGLTKQFRVVHSGSPLVNKEVRVAQISQMVELYVPLGVMNPQVSMLEQLAILREKSPERWLLNNTINRDPRQEIKAFANDHYLAPTPTENAILHYVTHVEQLLALDPMAAQELDIALLQEFIGQISPPQKGAPPKGLERMKYDPAIIVPQLVQHIRETEGLVTQLMTAMMQQAAAGAEEGLGPSSGPQEVSGTDGDQIAKGVAQKGTGTPKGVGGQMTA